MPTRKMAKRMRKQNRDNYPSKFWWGRRTLTGKIEIYKSPMDNDWRSRYIASNGRIQQISSEGYCNFRDLFRIVFDIYGYGVPIYVPEKQYDNLKKEFFDKSGGDESFAYIRLRKLEACV